MQLGSLAHWQALTGHCLSVSSRVDVPPGKALLAKQCTPRCCLTKPTWAAGLETRLSRVVRGESSWPLAVLPASLAGLAGLEGSEAVADEGAAVERGPVGVARPAAARCAAHSSNTPCRVCIQAVGKVGSAG